MHHRITPIVLLTLLSACAAPSRRAGAFGMGAVSLSAVLPANAFSADLAGAPGNDSTGRTPSGRITLTFRSHEHFEFDLILRDGEAPWTGAWIVRSGVAEPVAAIVAGVELRGAYSQLRGTGVLPSREAGPTLLERMRSAPGEYQIRVGSTDDSQALTGPLVAR